MGFYAVSVKSYWKFVEEIIFYKQYMNVLFYRNCGKQGIVKQVIQGLWSVLEEVIKEVLEKMAAVQNLL